MLREFKSLIQLEKAFPDEQSCIEYFRDLRWADGIKCVHCGEGKIYNLSGGGFKCAACLKKFTVRNGTIFEDSKLPLATWFKAIFILISNPKGVSSMELHRQLGITQKSAWFVVQRIRELMIANAPKPILTGTPRAPRRGTKSGGSHFPFQLAGAGTGRRHAIDREATAMKNSARRQQGFAEGPAGFQIRHLIPAGLCPQEHSPDLS